MASLFPSGTIGGTTPDPEEREHNFGTVQSNLDPKPAYVAVRTLTHQLGGYHIARRLALDNDKDFVLVCVDSSGQQALVAWTLGKPHSLRIPTKLNSQQLTAAACDGHAFTPKYEGDALVLDLTTAPQYVKLDGGQLPH